MKKVALIVLLLITSAIVYLCTRPTISTPTEESLSYFITTVTEQAKKIEGYDKLGLGGGVDGFTLVKAYPGFIPADFENVPAYQGYYHEENTTLFYTGHAASNSGVLLQEGMKLLLENTSKRLQISAASKKEVDRLLTELTKPS